VSGPETLMLLWRHECERVFSDKLTTLEDKAAFFDQLNICSQELLKLPPQATTVVEQSKSKLKNAPREKIGNLGLALMTMSVSPLIMYISMRS